ncbi:minor tail protein [Gordonia phage Schiebs]|nr:minor tail protein [Gordonia phage Schiebs]
MTGAFSGLDALAGVYAGTAPVAAIYAGTQQIWPMGPPPLAEVAREDFNVPDQQDLPQFTAQTDIARVRNQAANFNGLPANVGMLTYNGTFNPVPTVDDHAITAQLCPPFTDVATNGYTGLFARCGPTFNSGSRIALEVSTGSGSRIRTYVGSTGLNRATGPNVALTDRIRFECRGKYYAGYLNDDTAPFIEWTDTNTVVAIGPNTRRCGLSMQANYPLFQRQYGSPAVDWFSLGQWPA